MEQKKARAHYDDFAEQFTELMYEHWSDILLIINRHSPRVAALLRVATPAGLKRVHGVWRIQIMVKRIAQRDKLSQPRDNEIVAQAIRLFYHQNAGFTLPRVVVDFEF